jgi:hypothetical protein
LLLPHRQSTIVASVPSVEVQDANGVAIPWIEHVSPSLAILQIEPVIVQQAHLSVAIAPLPLHF